MLNSMVVDGIDNTAQNEELTLASATDNQRNNIIENDMSKNDKIIGSTESPQNNDTPAASSNVNTTVVSPSISVDESNNGNRDKNDVNNSIADEKATPKEVVSTDDQLSEKKSTTPAPPRWRFVNEAKKSNGYSSSFAGSYIKGQSSDELGAKYKPPDISLYKPKQDKIEPGKLKFYSEGKTDEEIYQVDVGCKIHDEIHIQTEETADDVNKGALFLNNNNDYEVDASTNETDVNQSANGTDDDDNQSTNELSNHIMAEQTTVMIKVDEGSRRKKYKRWMLFTLVVFLLLLVVVLGVLLGKNNNDNGRSASSAVNVDGATAVPPVVIVAAVNETDVPSLSPSYLSTNKPTIQAPSTNVPSIQAPTLPRQEAPSASPTTAVSSLPSQMTSQRPSSKPSFPPTEKEPTISPVVFIGACPQTFVPFLPYKNGDTVESNGIVYECIREKKCSTSESLFIKGWVVVGSCKGSREPTLNPTTLSPTSAPSSSPSVRPTEAPSNKPTSAEPSKSPNISPTTASPSPKPSEVSELVTPSPSTLPSNRPTPVTTCSTEQDFNLCLAVDMSGSVCNDGDGSDCEGCSPPTFFGLNIFFLPDCRDSFVSEDTCCNNFANVKDFSSIMVNLLDGFNSEKDFSVVQFATNAQLVSNLSSAEQTDQVIERLDYTGGFTNHASAIQTCQQTFPSRGSSGRKNFIMLVTDGVPSEPEYDPEGAAKAAASSAKSQGTIIIPVFISPYNDFSALSFMRRLSSDGKVFDVTDFDSLDSLQDSLIEQVSCS